MGESFGDAVALIVDGAPKQVFEFHKAHTCHRRDKHRVDAFGHFATHFSHKFIVEHIALGDGEHTRFVHEVGIEFLEFAAEHLIVGSNIVGVGGNHKEQHGISLNVAKETQSQAFAFACALDDARYVGHNKRLRVAIAHDAEIGLERGEGVVGNLWFCCGD